MNDLLPFGKAPKPAAIDALLPDVLVYLQARSWVSAKELARTFGTCDRTIRAVASASYGQIISGQQGYCLTSQATVEEANHAAAWLEHQAAQMTKRAYAIRQAMHQPSQSLTA